MTQVDRRAFLQAAGASALAGITGQAAPVASARMPARSALAPAAPLAWLEIDDEALRHNTREVARLAAGRPILAVVKNNAYGLGVARVGPVFDAAPEVLGFAVVKPREALTLREAGVKKPILFMGRTDIETGVALARAGVRLAAFTDDALEGLAAIARASGAPVPVHLYLDTGMSRMGMPYHRAMPWAAALAGAPHVRIEGTFTELAEREDFDPEQIARFEAFVAAARARGLSLGRLHASSSHALFHRPAWHFDAVRPGLALYGAYPDEARALGRAELRPAYRLRARVIRVERVRPGDGVSYGRNYVAQAPTWIATLAVGHADGYPRRAVQGGAVLVGTRTYPVIGAVSASHTILEIGEEPSVAIGDVATLVGPDHPAIHPNALAERAGVSVYDVLMHLAIDLPKARPQD
ncbi:MAG: alanine racemase [Gemmatimonadales bacterium]